jgi:predicted metal-dependent hydrolase
MLSFVQLELPFLRAPRPAAVPPVDFVRERRARRYILRIQRDGSLRVTIPRGGSRREAEAFLAKHRQWAERERQRVAAAHAPAEWYAGDVIPLDGVPVVLRVERRAHGTVLCLGGVEVPVPDPGGNIRPEAERALRRIAVRDLVPRLHELARRHDLAVSRVTVRNQQSRWGSCSRAGAIALNFRLVQAPPAVRDYVLLHELMHIRQPNHSRRFWRLVEEACPEFREAERWLRGDGRTLF